MKISICNLWSINNAGLLALNRLYTKYEILDTNYLRAYKALHLSRNLYKSALFMQNKANLPDDQMNVSTVITKEYENNSNCKLRENKANTNPIKANQSQSNPIKCQNKPNTNPIRTQSKPISNGPLTPQEIAFSIVCELVIIRRLGHTPEIKRMTIASSNNWKAEGL
ncbi:hypothetical protein ES703_15801 [subsurface metagenome]